MNMLTTTRSLRGRAIYWRRLARDVRTGGVNSLLTDPIGMVRRQDDDQTDDASQQSAQRANLHTLAAGRQHPEGINALSSSLSPSSSLSGTMPADWRHQQLSHYHSSTAHDRAAAIILGFGSLAAVSYAGAQGVKAYNEWKESLPDEPTEEEQAAQKAEEESKEQVKNETEADKDSAKPKEESSGPRENIFKEWFGVGVGSKYYEGGFDDEMSRREAALILGVRESSSAARIKEAHRKLLILNHPDTGGSTYISGKINEAKELLMKGK